MTPEEFGIQIADERFLREIHHLLWIDPFLNKRERDAGWNCRDHAFILAGIAQLRGIKAHLVSGSARFIQGPTTGNPSIGLFVNRHAWIYINDHGTADISITLGKTREFAKSSDWGPFRIIGSKVYPRDQQSFVLTRDAWTFENFANQATHEDNKKVAVYFEGNRESFDPKMLVNAFDWCNSPLTLRLGKIIKKNAALYPKAIMHLSNFLDGKSESLTGMPKMLAWKEIATGRDESAQQVIEAMTP